MLCILVGSLESLLITLSPKGVRQVRALADVRHARTISTASRSAVFPPFFHPLRSPLSTPSCGHIIDMILGSCECVPITQDHHVICRENSHLASLMSMSTGQATATTCSRQRSCRILPQSPAVHPARVCYRTEKGTMYSTGASGDVGDTRVIMTMSSRAALRFSRCRRLEGAS